MIPGIDVSRWQAWDLANWQTARNAGYQFAFIKAGEAGRLDYRFIGHWENAAQVGMHRGAYIFYRHLADPVVQAKQLVSIVGGKNELPLVVDVEEDVTYTQAFYGQRLHTCLQEVQELSGQRVMVYTSASMWNRLVGKTEWAGDFMLWVAQYPYNQAPKALATFKLSLPVGWTRWHYWQYSGNGQIPGIKGDVDLDFINGGLPCSSN